jgi:hypothetical protein
MNGKTSFVIGAVVLAGVAVGTLLLARTSAAGNAASPAKAQPQAAPIVSGKLVSITVWDDHESKGSRSGQTYKEGRVDFYENFIILTLPGGDRTVVRNGYYSGLWFKSE